jgi:hypothetical protein
MTAIEAPTYDIVLAPGFDREAGRWFIEHWITLLWSLPFVFPGASVAVVGRLGDPQPFTKERNDPPVTYEYGRTNEELAEILSRARIAIVTLDRVRGMRPPDALECMKRGDWKP